MASSSSTTARIGLRSSNKSNTSSTSDLGSGNILNTSSLSCYNKEYYSSLLYDENPNGKNYYNIQIISMYTEKELFTYFDKITSSFRKTEEWQLRINALETLQGMAKGGDALKFDCFVSLLKNCHELVELQILDLRSSICKEACRAVAVLSQCILQSVQTSPLFASIQTSIATSTSPIMTFYNLLELWIPKLIKQTGVKIQVIAMSADKSIRLIIQSFAAPNQTNSSTYSNNIGGFSKLFFLLADQLVNSKTAVIRKYCVEYACLAVALWSHECIEKNVTLLRTILSSSIKDADPSARKSGRQLYWLLKLKFSNKKSSVTNSNIATNARPGSASSSTKENKITSLLETFYNDLDPSVQKHIVNEYPCKDIKSDLYVLLSLINANSTDPIVNNNTVVNEGNTSKPKLSVSSFTPTITTTSTNNSVDSLTLSSHSNKDIYADIDIDRSNDNNYSNIYDDDYNNILSLSNRSETNDSVANQVPISLLSSLSGTTRSVSATRGNRKSLTGATRILPASYKTNKTVPDNLVTEEIPPVIVSVSTSSSTQFLNESYIDQQLLVNQSDISLLSSIHSQVSTSSSANNLTQDIYTVTATDTDNVVLSGSTYRNVNTTTTATATATVPASNSNNRRMTLNGPAIRMLSKNKQPPSATASSSSSLITTMNDQPPHLTINKNNDNMVVLESNNSIENKENDKRFINQIDSSIPLNHMNKDHKPIPPLPPQPLISPRLFTLGNIDNETTSVEQTMSQHGIALNEVENVTKTVSYINKIENNNGRSTSPFLDLLKRSHSNSALVNNNSANPADHDPSNKVTSLPSNTDNTNETMIKPRNNVSSTNRRRSMFLDKNMNNNNNGNTMDTGTVKNGTVTVNTGIAENNQLNSTVTTSGSSSSTSISQSTAIAASNILFSQSLDTIKNMCKDSFWSTRVKAFETINNKLRLHMANTTTITNSSNTTSLSLSLIDQFADLSSQHISDTHLKVAQEAFITFNLLIEQYGNILCESKNLGNYIVLIFSRLIDRKLIIKDSANELINKLKNQISPVVLLTVLSTKMIEINDRLKVPLLQYLALLIPYGGVEYFSNNNTLQTFLNRLATLANVGNNNTNGSTSGNSAAMQNNIINAVSHIQNRQSTVSNNNINGQILMTVQKLLELIYQTANRSAVCTQISLLPYQNQLLVRKLLERHVPDIDNLVNQASKVDFVHRVIHSNTTNQIIHNDNEHISLTNNQMNIGSDIDSLPIAIPTSLSLSQSTKNNPSSPLVMQGNKNDKENTNFMKNHSLSSSQETSLQSPSHKLQLLSPQATVMTQMTTPINSKTTLPPPPPPPVPVIMNLSISDILINLQFPSLLPISDTTKNTNLEKTIKWLANSITKTNHNESDEFWRLNCSQIVSVLLNVFMFPPSYFSNSSLENTTEQVVVQSPKSHTTAITGYSPILTHSTNKTNTSTATTQHLQYINYLHMTCKLLVLLVKHRNIDIQNMKELLVMRLTPAVSHVPQRISLYFEEILTELAHTSNVYDIVNNSGLNDVKLYSTSGRLISLLLPYLPNSSPSVKTSDNVFASPAPIMSSAITIHLFVLHVLTEVVRYVSTKELLEVQYIGNAFTINSSNHSTSTSTSSHEKISLLHNIINKTIGLLSSSVIDLRQSVIALYVEIYGCLGDVLWSYLSTMSQTQKALLSVFIDRKIKKNKNQLSD